MPPLAPFSPPLLRTRWAAVLVAALALAAGTHSQTNAPSEGAASEEQSETDAPAAPSTHLGWVMDLGALLTPAQEQSLEDLLHSYTQGGSDELGILVVDGLDGQTIEAAPRRVAREWQVGSGDHRNAALLVVAREERVLRWMVGRELQDRLTDSLCGRIAREIVAPEFDHGRYYEGLRAGVEAASHVLMGDVTPIEEHPGRRGTSGAILGTFLAVGIGAAAILRSTRRRASDAGAMPLITCTGTGKDVGYRAEPGSGSFRRFSGGGGFQGAGATGRW